MAFNTMYSAEPGSPVTTTSSAITETDLTIPLNAPGALPAAPNLATLYDDSNFETVLYTSKDATSITVDSRALEGVARAWGSGTKVSRLITAKDHDTFKYNFENIAGADVDFDDTSFFDTAPDVATALNALSSAGVVDEGSTADGDYIRYENGWQICVTWIQLDYTSSVNLTADWSFPVSFASGYNTIVNFIADEKDRSLSINRENLTLQGVYDDEDYETTVQLKQWSSSLQSGDYIRVHAFAIGRWK